MDEIAEFLKKVDEQYAVLDGSRYIDATEDAMYAGIAVDTANEFARRVGAGHLAVDPTWEQGVPYFAIDNAKTILGRMRLWCHKELQSTPKRAEALPTPETIKEWYTPKELAELKGKSPYTVRERWCNDGRIECEKDPDSGKWRIPGKEVKRLLNGGELGPKKGR